jgi:hypothetical protein
MIVMNGYTDGYGTVWYWKTVVGSDAGLGIP